MSSGFSRALMVAHAVLLALLILTRWLHVPLSEAIRQLIDPPSEETQAKISRRVSPSAVLTRTLSAMIVGCLCARSLHYQFYAYVAWSTPFLLWKSGLHPVLIYAIWAAQEWAWNVYPSSNISSIVVVGCLQITFLGVLLGTSDIKSSDNAAT